MFGESAEPMAGALKTDDMGLRLTVSPRGFDVNAFKMQLDAARGQGGEITLLSEIDGNEVELKMPHRYRLDASLRGALKAMSGVLYCEDV